jgi:hypothetical protein
MQRLRAIKEIPPLACSRVAPKAIPCQHMRAVELFLDPSCQRHPRNSNYNVIQYSRHQIVPSGTDFRLRD